MIKSEVTKNMEHAQIESLRTEISNMSPEELKDFRNSFDPDEMGFDNMEGVNNE